MDENEKKAIIYKVVDGEVTGPDIDKLDQIRRFAYEAGYTPVAGQLDNRPGGLDTVWKKVKADVLLGEVDAVVLWDEANEEPRLVGPEEIKHIA